MTNFQLSTRRLSPGRGFTLVETLVAISILVLAVTGAFSAARSGIASDTGSRNQIIAFYLAQEGVEELRNIRDNNGLAGQNWLTGIAANSADPCWFGKACIVDAPANTVTSCSGGPGSCPVLREDPSTGFYGYNSLWTPTNFTREITISQIPSTSDEVSILVTVSWTKGLASETFRVRENITNWQ